MRFLRLLPLLLFLLASAGAPAEASAQDPSPVAREGRRVRLSPNPVSPGEPWLVGTVHRIGADTIWLRLPDFVEPVWVLRSDVRRVQVSRGPRDRSASRLAGAALGGTLGALGGALLGDGGGTCMVCPPPELALAVPGALLGGLIGASGGREKWVGARLPQDADTAAFAVSPLLRLPPEGGAGVGVSFRF